MGASSSSEAAPDELNAQFDATELQLLRKAYARLANQTTGALDAEAFSHLAPGVPWVALHAAMRAENPEAPVRWRNFLGVVAAVCKGRPSERREFVAGTLYADPPYTHPVVSKASLERLVADAAIAARGGDDAEPPAGTAIDSDAEGVTSGVTAMRR